MSLLLEPRSALRATACHEPPASSRPRPRSPPVPPRSTPTASFAALRRREYGRLDAEGQVYLDYTGGGLHAASQIDAHAELLAHARARQPALEQPDVAGVDRRSSSGPAAAVLRVLQRAARRVPLHLHRQRQRGAAAGRRGVPVRARRHVRPDVRQPQLGQRHPRVRPPQGRRRRVRARGRARAAHRPRRDDRACCAPADPAARNLLAFPAQSNFSGVQHPLDLVDEAHDAGWDVLARRGRVRADEPARRRRRSGPTS